MTPAPPSDQILVELTTHTTREVVIRLAVAYENLRTRPAEGTLYKDLSIATSEKPDIHRWGSYKLLAAEDGPPGYHYFFFSKVKTEEEKWTPVETWEDYEVETWPPILEGLNMVQDRGAPVSVSRPSATDPRARAYVYPIIASPLITPQTTALCQVKWERFQADTEFEGLNYPRPIPGEVRWDFGVMGSASFTALHSDIKVRRPPGRYQTVEDATPGFVDAPFRRDLLFPRTRFQTWRPYVFAVRPSKINHLYVLDRATIYPPPKPRPVRT